MLVNIIKKSFSDKNLLNQFRRYGQQHKKVFEKRRSIIAEIEQDLKSIAYLSSKTSAGEQGVKSSFLYLENPLFYMVNKNSAQKIHQELNIDNQLFESIKNLFEINKENEDILQKIFVLTRNPLFFTPQIQSYLLDQLNNMLKDQNNQLFCKCIQGNKKFLKFFLPNLKKNTSINVEAIFNPNAQIEIDLEEGVDSMKVDDLKYDVLSVNLDSTAEENQKNSQLKKLLDSQLDDQNVNYHESNIMKVQQSNMDMGVVLQDLHNPDITYEINNSNYLKLAEIEFSNSANSNFNLLVRKMEDESSLYSLYLLLKSYEDSVMGEAKDDITINNFIKRMTTIQPEQFIINLIRESLLETQSIQVDNLIYIISKTRNIDINFSISCLKQLLNLKGQNMLIDELVNLISISTQVLFNSQYKQDQVLEEQISQLLTERIFSNLNLDVLNLKICFFDLLKICTEIKMLKNNTKYQDMLIEISLQLYGDCFQIPEQDESKDDQEIQAFKDIESVEKFARCVQVISKGYQSDLTPETKVLFKTFIENILIQQAYKQSNVLLYQLMDILVNTFLIYDIPKFIQLNTYVKTNYADLFKISTQQDEKIQSNSYSNGQQISKKLDFDIKDEDGLENSIKYSSHFQICSYFRFVSKFKFIKHLELDFIEELITALPKNDLRPFIYIYESILSNHSIWIQEDNRKLETFQHLQDICYILLKNTPQQLGFPINLCISLRNYLTFNSLYLKQYHAQIVDLSEYKITNALQKQKLNSFNVKITADDKEDQLENDGDIAAAKQICFPFNIELIKKISSVNKNLKLFLQQYLYEERSEITLQKKRQYLFDQIEYQINNNYPNPKEIFEIIRTQTTLRKQLQQNPNHFSIIKKYTAFLLKADYSEHKLKGNLMNSSIEGAQNQGQDKELTIEEQQNNNLQVNRQQNQEGMQIFSEILFLVRLCQEQQSRSFDYQIMMEFIEKNINEMDFTALLFSKQYINTANIKDPRVHSSIQMKLMSLIKPEHLNLKNSLNLLKAFSLEDFDEKTLFLLENEVVTKLNLVNLTNLTVLFKKYYYKARWNPIRLVSGVSQNAFRYLNQINDQTYWMFLFLNKFKPSTFSHLKLEQIQFQKEGLSQDVLLKFVLIFLENDLNQLVSSYEKLSSEQNGFNKDYFDLIKEERKQLLKSISHRREILAEKLSFYLNKLPSNESNQKFYKEILQLINTNTLRVTNNFEYTYQHLSLFYYFQVGEQEQLNVTISNQIAKAAVQNLIQQYQGRKLININQLISGFHILSQLNKNEEKSFFTYNELITLYYSIIEENRISSLSETYCLSSLMKLYQITYSFIEKESSKLSEEQISNLSTSMGNSFLFYKFKRNESKAAVISWISLIYSNKRNINPNSKAKELIRQFNGEDFKILDKLEMIFIKKLESLEHREAIEIFNAFFITELSSFQLLEVCDKFLRENSERQSILQQRVQSRKDHTDTNNRIAIPHSINHSRKKSQF